MGQPISQVKNTLFIKNFALITWCLGKEGKPVQLPGWEIPWLKVNMLTEPAHFHETSQSSKQINKFIYILNLFMKQTNSFTEASQLRLGQPASFNQLLRFFPVIKIWVLYNTEWSWSFSIQAISQLTFTCSKSKIETMGKGVKYVQIYQ